MATDVVLVRDGPGYRVVFGYLRLAASLNASTELPVDIKGDGRAVIVMTKEGPRVNYGGQQLPLLTI